MANYKRERQKNIAADTLDIIESGFYENDLDKIVFVAYDIAESLIHSEYLIDFPITYHYSLKHDNFKLKVVNETTMQGIYRISKEYPGDRIGCLNFASANKPGGGFINGASAQEECLTRSSGLFSSLIQFPDFYKEKRAPFYSDDIIYSPQVPFFKNDDGSYLTDVIKADVITCAAPNISGKDVDRIDLFKVFLSRIDNILFTFKNNFCDHIILGAWGCGVFANDPYLVAEAFKIVIKSKAYDRYFKSITFSIVGESSLLEAFSK